jgi:hypothetical protein
MAYEPESWACFGDGQLQCDTSVTPALCRGPGAPGASCLSDRDCDGTSVRECPGTGVTECAAKLCRKVQFGGRPCADPNSMCHPAFACEGGACKASGLQGIFSQDRQQ